jgi:tetratricopeptide (TPR) repeat protein
MFSFLSLHAQSADSLVANGIRLEKAMQESKALQKYYTAIKIDSDNAQALWRASILNTREGMRQSSEKAGKSYFNAAKNLAVSALRKNSNNKEANVAMAMALWQLSLSAGAKEKAAYIKEVKTYINKALLIDSSYALAWHMSGNWNYEVSTLGFAERAATKLLFGKLPAASLDRAVKDYEKCRELDPRFIQNMYDLAKAYHAQNKDLQAISTLKQALRLRPVRQDDRNIQEECRKMIGRLQ